MFRLTLWGIFSRNYASLVGILLVVAMVLAALFGPVFAPYGFREMHTEDRVQAPSTAHLLGTDQFGRDILTRILYGARISLTVGVTCTAAAALLGVIIGLIGGYFGGLVDEFIMRFMDLLMAFPSLVLAITLMALMGANFFNLIAVIGITRVPQFARLVRSSVLSIKEREFIMAARTIGQADAMILLRHILPNCVTPVVVLASLSMATAIVAEASLSFLGLGVQPPNPSWGGMLSEGRAYILDAPWMIVFPGLAVSLTTLGLNLLGDGLRDAMDPRTRSLLRSNH